MQVAQKSDIVFSIVGFPSDVNEVMLGPDGVVNNIRGGGIVVDMTTSEPSLAISIAEIGRLRNVQVMDAPVSGGDIGARNAALSIMCGGDLDAFNTVVPYFNLMGKNIRRMGEAGCGQHTKMVVFFVHWS